jgi:flavorubredoxin
MSKQVSQHITWVGKVDWQLTKFHGDELSTPHGSSYNSYLVRGGERTVLVDTVWQPFDCEFVARLRQEIDLNKIDAIVMNHNEIDHSGALPELMRALPAGIPIYCTAKGEAIIRAHYHQDWNYRNVRTGDTLDLGGGVVLTFFEAPMLHWPDTMFTHVSADNVLLSNDGFGQHYASESLFNDCVPTDELMWEAMKYYANILAPFSAMVKRKLAELQSLGLKVDIIAPSHGVIWKENPMQIVEAYAKWCDSYAENRITLVYDTMWNSTRLMAEAIAEGISQADPTVTVKLCNAAHHDKNDILTEAFRSKAVLAGSPTINAGISYAMAGLLEMLKGLKLKGKAGAAFGSFGWSCEGVKHIAAELTASGFRLVSPDGISCKFVPDEAELERCRAFGREFVAAL